MPQPNNHPANSSQFTATLQRPAVLADDAPWAFVILPVDLSNTLPRRGRTSVDGSINGHEFRATLAPDGKLSHWLKLDQALLAAAGADIGDVAAFSIAPVAQEPEPDMPADLQAALAAAPASRAVWDDTTTIARVDWIHWITSAKQAKTRALRISNACDMLAAGKRRVCCFDPSGFYSKDLSAPNAVD